MFEFWSKNRSLLAVILGMLTGFMMVAFVDAINHFIWPPDQLLDPEKPETIREYIEGLPTGALLFVALSQTLGMLTAAYVATRVAPREKKLPFIITSLVFLLAMIANFIMIPYHPVWLMLISFVGAALGAYLGRELALKSKPIKIINEEGAD